MSYGYIYSITNLVNDKVYIGQTHNIIKREKEHKLYPRKNTIIGRAIQKYGFKNFRWSVIDEADNQEELNELEQLHIDFHQSRINQWGYNIREGGSNGLHSEETKRKISISRTGKGIGRKFGDKNKKKLSKLHKGEGNPMFNAYIPQERRMNSSRKQWGKYPGVFLKTDRNMDDGIKCWQSKICINKITQSLGYFCDPISASIVYKIVWREIYEGVLSCGFRWESGCERNCVTFNG